VSSLTSPPYELTTLLTMLSKATPQTRFAITMCAVQHSGRGIDLGDLEEGLVRPALPSRSGRLYDRDASDGRPLQHLENSAKKTASPERESIRHECFGDREHAALEVFQRDLLGEHDVSDRQFAQWEET
jgi:hypothetical protein